MINFTICFHSTGGGGSGLYIGATVVTVSGLLGGATAYAGQSVEFRKSIEDAIPFSKPVFDMIHGDIPVVKKTATPVEVDLSIPFVAEVHFLFLSNMRIQENFTKIKQNFLLFIRYSLVSKHFIDSYFYDKHFKV